MHTTYTVQDKHADDTIRPPSAAMLGQAQHGQNHSMSNPPLLHPASSLRKSEIAVHTHPSSTSQSY